MNSYENLKTNEKNHENVHSYIQHVQRFHKTSNQLLLSNEFNNTNMTKYMYFNGELNEPCIMMIV